MSKKLLLVKLVATIPAEFEAFLKAGEFNGILPCTESQASMCGECILEIKLSWRTRQYMPLDDLDDEENITMMISTTLMTVSTQHTLMKSKSTKRNLST